MAATLSSSGTWTGLATNLAKLEDVAQPAPTSVTIHPNDLQTVPDEIRQMIRLAQDGWGAILGANRRLDYWATAEMLATMLQAYCQLGIQRSGDKV